MKNILIISGHPNLQQSTANRAILDELAGRLPHAQIRRLDALYPDYQIDIAAEQQALLAADVIVWQFPLFWYSLPALLKKWLDDVFTHGFAYGSGAKLGGKRLIVSFTTGSPAEAYAEGQAMNYAIEAFIPPLRQTGLLCGLQFGQPVISNSMMYIAGLSREEDLQSVQAKARDHAGRLVRQIEDLPE
jgi:NAD(P)H dehydrogenase (quinone)